MIKESAEIKNVEWRPWACLSHRANSAARKRTTFLPGVTAIGGRVVLGKRLANVHTAQADGHAKHVGYELLNARV